MKTITTALITLSIIFLSVYKVNSMDKKKVKTKQEMSENTMTAVFAGGCFWCTESDFEKVEGVLEVVSGYTGGKEKSPTYEQVASGQTGHTEAIKITYDPLKVTYGELLDVFWQHVDPTDSGGQFVDRGMQYRSAIFYANEKERQLAEKSRDNLSSSGVFDKPIVTEIIPAGTFYDAEEYHQDYYKKNPLRYNWYRSGSGRDQFLMATWTSETKRKIKQVDANKEKGSNHIEKMDNPPKKYTIPDDAALRKTLTPIQFKVTRKNGTEPPFDNAYWENHDEGIYVDIISGEPLFSSTHKFDSGTGWPSFTQPLENDNIVEKSDTSHFMTRVEVRSKNADSHLGHVFNDGPEPTGLRYCINSAALRFVPVKSLEAEGYGEYLNIFK